jgi:3-mercaptopyruvate sulfurtransferase SseA
MPIQTSFLSVLILALFLLPLTAAADSGEAWWTTAEDEAARDGYRLLDTAGLLDLVRSDSPPLVIDVRADYEYEAGHVPGAVNLEFDLGDRGDLDPDKSAAFAALAGPDRTRPMVIYCRSFR